MGGGGEGNIHVWICKYQIFVIGHETGQLFGFGISGFEAWGFLVCGAALLSDLRAFRGSLVVSSSRFNVQYRMRPFRSSRMR
jgi:hypothetical protein